LSALQHPVLAVLGDAVDATCCCCCGQDDGVGDCRSDGVDCRAADVGVDRNAAEDSAADIVAVGNDGAVGTLRLVPAAASCARERREPERE